jgi:asparagine synthetase B (glutamine-hydrolysing)
MCVFRVTNSRDEFEVNDAGHNIFMWYGGPDARKHHEEDGITFSHGLLHMTGELSPQPIETDRFIYMFVGELYGVDLSTHKSEIKYLIEVHSKNPDDFYHDLDGEFTIIIYDRHTKLIHIYNDPWATRACWYTERNGSWCLSTTRPDADSFMIEPNSHYTFDGQSLIQVNSQLHRWDFTQTKTSFDSWTQAFYRSVEKRTEGYQIARPGLLLSAGYDSSAIAVALHDLKRPFVAITHYNTLEREDKVVYRHVQAYCKTSIETKMVRGSLFNMTSVLETNNTRLLLSGMGSDEIFNYESKSNDKWVWSDDLKSQFPWEFFWWETLRLSLRYGEMESLRSSVEIRHPYLDKNLVQEFFNLHPSLKNSAKKAPIANFLQEHGIPLPKIQMGFDNYVGGSR